MGLKAKECEGLEHDKCKEKERNYDSLQLALKIMMNAFFGILSVPYSRYFNTHIAEAITSCGRHTIKEGQRFCNDLLNDPRDDMRIIEDDRLSNDLLGSLIATGALKNEDRKDYVKYIDTDSLFGGLGEWIKDMNCKRWDEIDDEQKIIAAVTNSFDKIYLLIVQFGVQKQTGHANHGIEGCANFVAGVGQEFAFSLTGCFGGLQRCAQIIGAFADGLVKIGNNLV